MNEFERLIHEAEAQAFSGWDFAFLTHRMKGERLSWDYEQRVLEQLKAIDSLLDMGTGGGEFLSSLSPLPLHTCATEAYPPNVPVAKHRLEPLGIKVFQISSDDDLPFGDAQFDCVINRHESYSTSEVYRIIKPGGTFITQQTGGTDQSRINEFLGVPSNPEFSHWNLDYAVHELELAGFEIIDGREEFPKCSFTDIGAVLYYLKVIEWQVPGFSTEKYRNELLRIHREIKAHGELETSQHRFLIEAVKPNE